MADLVKMTNTELAALINSAQAELDRRKTERANKLIEKACDTLNELQSLGVIFSFEEQSDYGDSYTICVFDGERIFTPDNFHMTKEIK